jgi:uncharacterized damage-inducible protein DinB
MKTESQRLVELSEAVRDSLLKRLKEVPEGKENWRLNAEGLSFSDLIQHLIDADHWLADALEKGVNKWVDATPGMKVVRDRRDYERLLGELEKTQVHRNSLIAGLTDAKLEETIDDGHAGKMSLWWTIVNGCFDHETHHRGQIEAYLQMIRAGI